MLIKNKKFYAYYYNHQINLQVDTIEYQAQMAIGFAFVFLNAWYIT